MRWSCGAHRSRNGGTLATPGRYERPKHASTPQYYRDRAEACERLAERAGSTGGIQEFILELEQRARALGNGDATGSIERDMPRMTYRVIPQ
jgi:hypothetical protein